MSSASIILLSYLLAILIEECAGVGSVSPTRPLRIGGSGQNSDSRFLFYFSIETEIPPGNFIQIYLPEYGTPTGNPVCLFYHTNAWVKRPGCQYVYDAPNTRLHVFLPLLEVLQPNVEYRIQLDLIGIPVPVSRVSRNFALWTVSELSLTDRFVYDVNLNFAQAPYQEETPALAVSLTQAGAQLSSANQTNQIQLLFQINRDLGDDDLPLSSITLELSSPWEFVSNLIVTSQPDDRFAVIAQDPGRIARDFYKQPTIQSSTLLTPQRLVVLFSEKFEAGRAFKLTLNSIRNPGQQSQGKLRVRTTNFNSEVSLEQNENFLNLSIAQNPIHCEILEPNGIPLSAQVGLFRGQKQYLQVRFYLPVDAPANSLLRLTFGASNPIISGTAFLAPSSASDTLATHDATRYFAYAYSDGSLSISNLASLRANVYYKIVVKVFLSAFDANIQGQLRLDPLTAGAPPTDPSLSLFSGQTALLSLKTQQQPDSFLLKGDADIQQQLEIQPGTTPSKLVLSFKPSTQQTSTTSFLEVQTTSNLLQFSTPITCTATVNAATTALTVTTTTSAPTTTLRIEPNSHFQTAALAQLTVTITCSNLKFNGASHQSTFIYPLYFRYYSSSTVASARHIDWTITPNVRQISPDQSKISILHYGNVLDAGAGTQSSKNDLYPTLLDVQVSDHTFVGTVSGLVVFTLYAQNGFKNLYPGIQSQESYPCGCTLASVQCSFEQGDSSAPSTLFVDWDRVNVFFPSFTTSPFHLAIADVIRSIALDYNYVLSVQFFDPVRQTFTTKFTYSLPASLLSYRILSSQINVDTQLPTNFESLANDKLALIFSGAAGSEQSGVPMTIDSEKQGTPVTSFNLPGGALVIVTDWMIWQSGISTLSRVGSAPVLDASNLYAPLTFSYLDSASGVHHVLLIPLKTAAATAFGEAPYILDKILLPYSYDVPNYNIYLTQSGGDLVGHKQYINSGPGVFYPISLTSVDILCEEYDRGTLNTFCSFFFVPQLKVSQNSKIVIRMSAMSIFSENARIYYQNAASPCADIRLSVENCTELTTITSSKSSVSGDVFEVTLGGLGLLPEGKTYRLDVFGVTLADTIQHYFEVQVTDFSGNFVIQSALKIITTTGVDTQTITVKEIAYQKINPLVFSALTVKFSIPRAIKQNEELLLNMGKDLNDVNTNIERLSIKLTKLDASGNAVGNLRLASGWNGQDVRIFLFEPEQLTQGDYLLEIDNIRNPGSNGNDIFRVFLRRIYDGATVLQNLPGSTSSFPGFLPQTSSEISLVQQEATDEGADSSLLFNLYMKSNPITPQSRIYLVLPIYFTPSIANDQAKLCCLINSTQTPCQRDSGSSYRIVVSEIPMNIPVNQVFQLKVQGLTTPSFEEQNNPLNQKETIFVGVNDSPDQEYYTEYIHLNPFAVRAPTYSQYLHLHQVKLGSQFTANLTTHRLKIFTEIGLLAGEILSVQFPSEYTALKVLPSFSCRIALSEPGLELEALRTCPLEARTFQLEFTSAVPDNSFFWVELLNFPTPQAAGTIDYNKITVHVLLPPTVSGGITQLQLKTRNFYVTNRVPPVPFTKVQNLLIFNNDLLTTVTAGTYTLDLPIQTSDNKRFKINVDLQFQQSGFRFSSSQVTINTGDDTRYFRIGCDSNMQQRPYPLRATLSQRSYKSYYEISYTYLIFVVKTPITIDNQQIFTVQRGGCSLPYALRLSNNPFSQVSILLNYDVMTFPEHIFYINNQLSFDQLDYLSTTEYKILQFCVTSQFPANVNSIPVKMVLGGQNSDSYRLKFEDLTLNIVNPALSAPVLRWSMSLIQRTLARINFAGVSALTQGTIYYHLFVDSQSSALSLTQIKIYLKNQITILKAANQQGYNQTQFQQDERVGYKNIVVGDSLLVISNLVPQTSYRICGYFENSLLQSTGVQCLNFQTQDWPQFSKSHVTFTQKTYPDAQKDVLCYFINEINTQIDKIVDSQGNSCSDGVDPRSYYFQYPGKTYSNSEFETYIYHIPNLKFDTDPSISVFEELYERATTNRMKVSAKTKINNDYQISFISDSFFQTKFTYTSAVEGNAPMLIPTVKSLDARTLVNDSKIQLQLQNASLSGDGVLYFVLERTGQLLYDVQYRNYQKISIGLEEAPSPAQIVQCQNSRGKVMEHCGRFVIIKGRILNTTLDNLIQSSEYTIYYTSANEFPLFPVLSDQVLSSTVVIPAINQTSRLLAFYSIVLLLLVSVLI